MEKLMGPIEERFKNEVETIIRNSQERLSRDFMQSKLHVTDITHRNREIDKATTLDLPTDLGSEPVMDSSSHPDCTGLPSSDAMAPHTLATPPFEALPYSWYSHYDSQAAYADAGSIFNTSTALPSDPWWEPPDFVLHPSVCMMSGFDDPQGPSNLDTCSPHTGIGKERANEDDLMMNWNSPCFP
jgi:hypothetical protein